MADSNTPPRSRRDFLRTSLPAAALSALALHMAGCDSASPGDDPDPEPDPDPESGITIDGNTITIDLTAQDTQALTQADGFLLITAADTLAINVDGTIRAFTSVCTHQQCTINSFSNDRLVCPCHGSQFNIDGEVVQGPAPSGLSEYSVSRDDDVVTITK